MIEISKPPMFKQITPSGLKYESLDEFIKQTHLLIGGASGSGKSTLLNDLIWQLLYKGTGDGEGCAEMVLIDPKRVELSRYEYLPHTRIRAVTHEDICDTLGYVVDVMEDRFCYMEANRMRMYDGGDFYVVIDEYADICDNKDIVDGLIKIAQLGRASRIHIWLCTQRPTRDVINGRIKVNLDSRIALHCTTAQDSRNLIERKGAENIRIGEGIYLSPRFNPPVLVDIPYITDEQLDERVRHWTKQLNMTYYKKPHIAL